MGDMLSEIDGTSAAGVLARVTATLAAVDPGQDVTLSLLRESSKSQKKEKEPSE